MIKTNEINNRIFLEIMHRHIYIIHYMYNEPIIIFGLVAVRWWRIGGGLRAWRGRDLRRPIPAESSAIRSEVERSCGVCRTRRQRSPWQRDTDERNDQHGSQGRAGDQRRRGIA